MEKVHSLFRQEVIENRVSQNLGAIRINVPINYRLAGYGALMVLTMLLLFICFASISEKTYVKGYLDSENGVISVESDFHGLVINAAVEEGKRVHKGDVLFVIANPNWGQSYQQTNNLTQRISNLKREYQLKKQHHFALKKLFNKQFIALSTLIDSESSLLEIKNKLKSAEYDMLNFKENQNHIITAPISGIITNIFYHQGQSIQPARPLAHIIPEEAELVARLYIPAREIGFINLGQTVNLKYDAYPSHRFGFYQATVKEINQTVLTDDKEDKPLQIGEPYYKIKAKLNGTKLRSFS